MKLPIPIEALDDRLSIVGRSGYGKTNAAKVMAEKLLADGARVCILDPTDAWWGLRLKPDGIRPGFPVAIFGGQKGDLALNEHAGETIGTAIATSSQSTIVSMADFVGENARRRFASAFLAALYQHNREPLHLIVDEADTLAPQKPIAPLDAEVLARMQQIVRRGRIRGFVPYLITQRPAVLNKDVLSQADGLIAFNLISSQDRDAIGAWIEGQADKAEQKALLATLPKLERGTAMVWLPGRGILQQVEFPLSTTFDSGRTPKRGEAKPTATLKPIDVAGLAGKIAVVEEKRKADDPTLLRKRIAELETSLAQAKRQPAAPPVDNTAALEAAHQEGWIAANKLAAANMAEAIARLAPIGPLLERFKVGHEAGMAEFAEVYSKPAPGIIHRQDPYSGPPRTVELNGTTTPEQALRLARKHFASSIDPAAPARFEVPISAGISGPQQRILDALAWLESIGINQVDRTRTAMLADQSPKSSGFRANASTLSGKGLICFPVPGEVALTDTGREAANRPPAPPTNTELHAMIRRKISGPQWAILEALITAHPGALTREALAPRAGQSPDSSGYRANISTLSGFGFVTYPQTGSVKAADILFIEGR